MLTLSEQKQLNQIDNGSHSNAVHAQVGTYRNEDPAFSKRLESALNERFETNDDLIELLVGCFMRGDVNELMQALAQDCTYNIAQYDVDNAAREAAADLREHWMGVATL